ncbi:Fc.00g064930.m01.CDS01 [Cosmosporella sp. VM-42]
MGIPKLQVLNADLPSELHHLLFFPSRIITLFIMKSAIFSIALLAGLVAAQSNSVPSCAAPCLNEYTSGNNIAGCKNGAVKCICENDDFLDGIACCLDQRCDEKGKAAAVKFAQQICSTAGVTVPDEVVCKNTTSTESGSATESAASETASGTATGTADSASSGTGSATDAAVSSSTSPGAAAGLAAEGVLGVVAAMLLAL